MVLLIQACTKFLKRARILRPGLSEKIFLSSALPKMIQLSGKSTNFGSKMSILSKKSTNQQR